MSENHDEVGVAKVIEKVEEKEIKENELGCTLSLCAGWSFVGAFFIAAIVLVVTLLKEEDCPGRSEHGYITLIFANCPSSNQVKAFESAADRLSAVVSQTRNLFPQETEVELRFADVCGANILNSNPVVYTPGPIENLVITASTQDIDGVEGILAQAGPCQINLDTDLPFAGLMLFDSADLELMEFEGILEDVILHEMLHVLGFGTLWDLTLVNPASNEVLFERDILEDEVFSVADSGVVTVFPANEPKFVGASGAVAYSSLTGVSETFVPVQGADIGDGQVFDVVNGEGLGSVDKHWNKADFGTELMSFAISGADLAHPLSAVSLSSLVDIGYNVNLTAADDFNLPRSNKNLQSLRGNEKVFDLSGDVLRISPKAFSLN